MSDDESGGFKLNMKKLENFIKALKKEDAPAAKLGVLQSSPARKGTAPTEQATNAEIAKKHEFGEEGMPIRSILRVPIMDNMQKYLEQRGYFKKETFAKIISESSLRELTAQVGIVGETIVSDAFDSGGFGKWQPSNMKYKTNHQTLVETRQLRDSITSEVEDD